MSFLLAPALALTLPLTAQKLEAYLAEKPEATLEQLLEDLPAPLHESFVLVHRSRSLHLATPEAPRQILFGSDARFLAAASGVEDDPRFQLFEFAEFSPEDGNYHFGTIDFASPGRPVLTKDSPRCGACHGTPTRPIWGQYPRWDGAFGDEKGEVATTVQEGFRAFVAKAPEASRYKHLVFDRDATGRTFKLSARYYPYPNTDFNHELGNTVALGAMIRLKRDPGYARGRHAALATNPALSCIDSDAWTGITRMVNTAYAAIQDRYPATTRVDVKALRLMGFDPVPAFSLEQINGDPARGTAGQYQTGAFRIEEALGFQLLVDVMADDAVVKDAFAPEREAIDYIAGKARLTGEGRADALRRSSAWFLFFDVFDPVARSRTRLDQVCERLAQRSSQSFSAP